MADATSIEETNKIRKSLGLPLLAVPGAGPIFKDTSESESEEEKRSTLESRQAQSYDNYKRAQDEVKRKAARDAQKEAIRKARNIAAKSAKLEGQGLGEEDDQEQDARSWLMSQKKRQKKIEREREKLRKIEEELKAREEQTYTAKDLVGVRVAHELDDFEDENDHVLVLKDATIDEDDDTGDELENIDLRDQERRDERLKLKKKIPVYDPNNVEEDGKSNLLMQYDEVIEGKKRKRFTLDTDGQTVEQKEALKSTSDDRVKRQAISLDILKDLPQSDYAEAKEVKVRKPKKQKTKLMRKKTNDDEDNFLATPSTETNDVSGSATGGGMDVDGDTTASVPRIGAVSLVDDEDLQASLSRQRRDALKKRTRMRPEDLAKQLREEEANAIQEDEEQDGGLVIDETTFFVDNIDERQREIENDRETAARKRAATSHSPTPDHNVHVTMEGVIPTADTPTELTDHDSSVTPKAAVSVGLDDETSFNQGLGSVFNFIKGRGMWEAHEGAATNEDVRGSQIFRSEKRRMETDAEAKARAQRLAGREAGRYQGHSQREREEMHRKENEHRQQQESQRMARFYQEHYRPSFELVYSDEHGREMNQKEAFKHLSHQFHGKGSGKMKTEKHLKKIEDEKKATAKSLLDNSQMSNYSNAADATAKRRGTFGVQLGK